MASPRDLLTQAKAQIKEAVPAEVEPLLGQVTLLDVREPDENEQGAIPGSIHLPRGHLEFQVEGKIPDKDSPIVVYCAGGSPLGVCCPDDAGSRIQRRRLDGRRIQSLEGRGPSLGHA